MATDTMDERSSRDLDLAAAFMGTDGTVWHSRCAQPLQYHGTRGGLVVDFFCPDCQEHVSLPLRRLPSLDMDRQAPGHWAPRFVLTDAD